PAVGFIFRAYHAIPYLTNKQGQSTGALFGFIQSVLKVLKERQPDHLVAVFDGPNNKESRLAIYPDYKANRGPCPPDLHEQIDWAQDFCQLYGIPQLRVSGVEADDTMGSVAKWAEEQGAHVYVCTSDKDMAQIVTDKVHLLNEHTKNPEKAHLDPKGVEQVFGVRPDQIIDFLALTGDNSDNVPGIPGCGPKTASALLQQFGTIETILQSIDQISGKKRQEMLREHGHVTEISRKLVSLDLHVPFPHEEEFYALSDRDRAGLEEFYRRMDFEDFLRNLAEAQKQSQAPKTALDYTLVDSSQDLSTLIKHLNGCTSICFDTETTGLRPLEAELVGLGFCTGAGKAWYVPTNGHLGKEAVVEALKPVFENTKLGFFGHNAKYDLHILENVGIRVARLDFDTILASYVLRPHDRRHGLDHLALEHFNFVKTPTEALIGKGKSQITMADVPIQQVCDYCCEDVDYTWRLREIFEPELQQRGLTRLLTEMELPLTRVLQKMERYGMFLDLPVLEELGKELITKLEALCSEIFEEAGHAFNLNSPKQLGEVLFEKMGIPAPKKTKTGYSTSADILEQLSGDYPFVEKILEYRMLEKLRSTYVEALPHEVNPKDGRVHCTFNQSVAATGRLAAQDPNLQNIPVRSALGRRVREAFRPQRSGWSYLSADYSQIELRLLAHMSEDPTLIQAFEKGEDIHRSTAAQVFDVPLDEVSKTQRYHAKAVNFGILYGQQAFGLAQTLSIPQKNAEVFIQRYFERFPRVKEYIEECKERTRRSGKAITLTGREREIPEITSKNVQLRLAAERLAVNSPLQGTAADLIKLAMLCVDEKLDKAQMFSTLVLQVHDELIFEAPDHELIELEALVRTCMQKIWKLRVPLVVDVSVGKNWKEC
ncbi:MAG: DNA polymerase I, partial [Chlamydiia bacterium]|nr:DNA polymerase I [Chlamydiia bacterium]